VTAIPGMYEKYTEYGAKKAETLMATPRKVKKALDNTVYLLSNHRICTT